MERYLITRFESHGREPVLYKMSDGSLFCTFLTGGIKEPCNENVVEYTQSFDNGKTWTERKVLFRHPNRGVWCTDICEWNGVPTASIHTYNADTHYAELQTFYSVTKDNGRSWSAPISFSGAINGCSIRQGLHLSNGEYLYPLYWQEATEDFSVMPYQWLFRSGVGISSDKGKTWARYGYFAKDYLVWEPNAVEVENGHIIIYFRYSDQSYRLAMSESFDYGRTWNAVCVSDIPNSNTKFIVKKIRNKIVLINNFQTGQTGFEGRTKLEIHVSDDGINFEKRLALYDENTSFFYPHAHVDDKTETLYIAYENGKEHYLSKISYAELGL